jgi:hypothetical protein
MIPRTVLMAQEVAAQLSSSQLDDYGNIILNGYSTVIPNSINKKAWQYKETNTPPVNLPSLVTVQPALKGWTNNYMQYYTQLQPNGYGVNPGDPAMFDYRVHSYTNPSGPIKSFGGNGTWISGGSGYTPGTYPNVPLIGGSGTGATANIVVKDLIDLTGPIATWTQIEPGQGYPAGAVVPNLRPASGTGYGIGAVFSGSTGSATPFPLSVLFMTNPGDGYAPGDVLIFPGGASVVGAPAGSIDAYVQVNTVGYVGTVTNVTLVNPGVGYEVGDSLTATIPGSGSGFYAPVGEITETAGTGGQPQWAQTPRRFFQNRSSAVTPPQYINNPEAIPYSFMYPVVDNPAEPPIDTL